jgi:hypothetical protein
MYTFLPEWQDTYARLFAYNPGLKLIYIMRHPVERVISNYSHDLVRGLVDVPPEVAIVQQSPYLNRSRYAVQLRPYLELFKPENILPLIFEEYVADQQETLRRLGRFLGLSPEPFHELEPEAKHRSVGEWQWKYSFIRAQVNSRAFRAAKSCLPEAVRKPIRSLLSNRLEERPCFSPTLRQTLWRFLEDDVRGIEELLGRRLEVWREGGAP